jgi:hypothetical protein
MPKKTKRQLPPPGSHKEDEARTYLLSKGWQGYKDDGNRLWNESRGVRQNQGGLRPRDAMEIEREFERIQAGKPVYKWRWNVGQLGCVVIEYRYTTDGKTLISSRDVLQHHDKEVAKFVASELNQDRAPDVNGVSYEHYIDQHNYSSALVFEEKHAKLYFRVDSPGDYKRVCLYVVKSRHHDGYWYTDLEDVETPEEPEIAREKVAQLKDGPIKDGAEQAWRDYDNQIKENRCGAEQKRLLEKALAGDAVAACAFLRLRADAEYEGFNLVELSTVSFKDIEDIGKEEEE